MVVQAETVPRTVDSGDLVRARAALAAVEETGRDALTEMRRLLGCFAATATAPSSPLGPALGGSRRWSSETGRTAST